MKTNQNYTEKEMPNFRERGGSLEVEAANGTPDGTNLEQIVENLNEMVLQNPNQYDQMHLQNSIRFFQESIDKLNMLIFKDDRNRTRPPTVYLDVYNQLTEQLHKCQLQLQQSRALDNAADEGRRLKANSTSILTDNSQEDEHSSVMDHRAPITLTESDDDDDDLKNSLRNLKIFSDQAKSQQQQQQQQQRAAQPAHKSPSIDTTQQHQQQPSISHQGGSNTNDNRNEKDRPLKRLNAYDNFVGATDSSIICRPDSLAPKLLNKQPDGNSLIGASTVIITSIGISKPSNPSSIASTPIKSPYKELITEFGDKLDHGSSKYEPLNSPTKIFNVHPSHSSTSFQSQTSSGASSVNNGSASSNLQALNWAEASYSQNSSGGGNKMIQSHNSRSFSDISDAFQHTPGSNVTTPVGSSGHLTMAPNPYLRVYIGNHTAVVKKENVLLRDALFKKLRQNNLEIDKCIAYIKEDNKKVDWDTEVIKIPTDHLVVTELNEDVKHSFEKKTFSLRSCESCRKRDIINLYQCSKCEYVMCQRPDCRKKSEKIVCCSKKVHPSFVPLHLPTHSRLDQDTGSGLDPIREISQQILPVAMLQVNTNYRRERSSSETELINAGLEQPETPRPNQKSPMIAKTFTTKGADPTASYSTLAPDIRINDINESVGSSFTSVSQQYDKTKLNENLAKKTVPSRRDSFNSWEIPHKQIKIDLNKKVGSGSFGIVHQGKDFYHGNVAIKFLNVQNPTPAQSKAFRNEVVILKSTRHDNILLFIGCILKPYLAIVTEWCPGSSLYRHLHVEEEKWEMSELISISKQTATGMEYLHARSILHRDLKSNNIFLIPKEKTSIQGGYRNQMNKTNGNYELDLDEQQSEKWTVKIGDFGLATVKSNWNSTTTAKTDQPTGSILWMAPEVIKQKVADPYTIKSDVYSFGVVLYELFTGNLPYSSKEQNMILFLVGSGRLKPNCEDSRFDTPNEIKSILTICCDYDRNKRPDFVQINELFKKIKIFKTKSKLKRAKSEPVLSQFEYSSSLYELNDDYPGTPSYNTSNRVNSPTNSRFGEYLKRYQGGAE